jgi:radical SAM superfamily enzyme YgiQ (UPF0313 family)
MIMDIIFIDPPYKAMKGIGTSYGYSLSSVSLAAYLRREGFEAAVITGNLLIDLPSQEFLAFNVKEYANGQKLYEKILNDDNHQIWKSFSQSIERLSPKAVGISCLTPAIDLVFKLALLVKQVDKEIKVVVGGHHPTFRPKQTLLNDNIDFIIRGEGEVPLLQLIRMLNSDKQEFGSLEGVAYKDKGDTIINSCSEMIKDLDSLPIPARDLVINCDFKRTRGHYVATCRGCPYSCSFCSDRGLWNGRVRRRSVENVIIEIKHLIKDYGVTSLDFTDGTFTYDLEYLRKFCRTVIDEGINVKWRCTARYDNINEETVELLKKANCTGLYFGLESGSERMLKDIHKRITVDRILEAGQIVYNSGIKTITSILLGLPNEDTEDLEKTLSLMRKLKTNLFDINCYVPLPGTELYDQMTVEEQTQIDYRKVGFKSLDNFFTKKISKEELKKYINEAHDIAEELQQKFLRKGSWG